MKIVEERRHMNKMNELTPRQIVEELDKYIIGQTEAKRAVAVALRNRYRREKLDADIRDEVIPKNILMIGPTGVGKTEIARRLAKLANAPFLKVEATKYTEVGYVGRDVESMIRDLVEISLRMVKQEKFALVADKAEQLALERLVELILPKVKKEAPLANPLMAIFGTGKIITDEPAQPPEEEKKTEDQRSELRRKLQSGAMDKEVVEIEVEESAPSMIEVFSTQGIEEMGVNFQDLLGGLFPKKKRKRRISIAEAKKILAHEEANKLIDMDEARREAITRAEQKGIVFLDELDKIAGREKGAGPDVSREGVQRDILPIVEGSTVMTKYGAVRTDHILFIAAGAFHVSKPSDLIPELQGRFPIRVELSSLFEEDLKKILTEPKNALIKQYTALLDTESISIVFTEDGIDEIARLAALVNQQSQNIGARRLHTIMEKLLEDLSFNAPEMPGKTVNIDALYVRDKLEKVVKNEDLSKYIL